MSRGSISLEVRLCFGSPSQRKTSLTADHLDTTCYDTVLRRNLPLRRYVSAGKRSEHKSKVYYEMYSSTLEKGGKRVMRARYNCTSLKYSRGVGGLDWSRT